MSVDLGLDSGLAPDSEIYGTPPEPAWDQQEMEVIQEPYLGREFWQDLGRSSDVEVGWEQQVSALLRSARRSCDQEQPITVVKHQEGKPEKGLPDHLQQLFEDSSNQLSVELQSQFASMLREFEQVFSKSDQDLGRTGLEVHRIPTGSARPVRLPPRRAPMHLRADIEQQVQTMLDQGIIEECTSPWAAPLVVVKKKDGSNRICVDYRGLNDVTEKDAHPIPRIGDSIDALVGHDLWLPPGRGR